MLNLPSRPLCGSGLLVWARRRGCVQDSTRATRPGSRLCVARRCNIASAAGWIKTQKMAARRRTAKGAECGGRVPALLVVMKVDGTRELGLGFDTGRIGGDEGPARYALGYSEQRWHDRRRRMTAQGVAAIVEIK